MTDKNEKTTLDALDEELGGIDFSKIQDVEVTLQGFTDSQLEYYISLSVERKITAEYDKKTLTESYNDIIKTEKERQKLIVDHLKTRREASKQANRLARDGVQVKHLANK